MSKQSLVVAVLAVLVVLLIPLDVVAQTELGAQKLGRGFWHVFAAYAIVWILVFGWLVKIGRQLARVEQKLDSSAG